MLKQMLIKECLLVLRDKHSLAALFIMPLIFILIMSMALKDTFNSGRPLLEYTLTDLDHSRYSATLQDLIRKSSFLRETVQATGNNIDIHLTIPKGFGDGLLQKERTEPLLQISAAPDVKKEVIMIFQASLRADIMALRLMRIDEEIYQFMPENTPPVDARAYASEHLLQLDYIGMPPDRPPTSTQQSVPSWIVFGMFFIIIPVSTVFINERKQNTLMRMASMNVSIPKLLIGKIIPYIIINQLQVFLMIGTGVYLVPMLGGDALNQCNSFGALLLVSISLSLAAIGTSIFIATLASTTEQATTIGGLINILFGAIGGVMVPKLYMPQSMQTFAHISPMSWGLEGFMDIFLRGGTIMDTIPESSALAGLGCVLLLLSATILGKSIKTE